MFRMLPSRGWQSFDTYWRLAAISQRLHPYSFARQESRGTNNSNYRLSGLECALFMRDSLDPVVDSVDLLLLELRVLKSQGPHLRIVHRFREPGTLCAPGEEIAVVYLVHRGRLC